MSNELLAQDKPPVRAAAAIAHRAGNDRSAFQNAVRAGVDWVETDVWWHFGRLVARHERAVWRLPVRYDEWKIGIAVRPALRLPEICALAVAGPQLLIDLKGSASRLPYDVVETLRRQNAIDRVAVCGQYWPILDAAVAEEPALRAFYSLGSMRQLGQLFSRPSSLPRIKVVSCAEYLLTSAVISQLIARGIAVIAWTVNDLTRACELVASGVAGITSDSLTVLAAVKQCELRSAAASIAHLPGARAG